MDLIVKDAAMVATPEGRSAKKGKAMGQLKIAREASIEIRDGKIVCVAPFEEIAKKLKQEKTPLEMFRIIDGQRKCVLPGFVDSHTHFIFGGYRPEEFLMRINGADYLDIHRMGGGIEATVKATRKASFDQLCEKGRIRLCHMLTQGITCVEGKSGYGMDLDTELRQLEVMKRLDADQPIDIVSTYLGAHTIPSEYKDDPDRYIDYMIEEVMPKVSEKKLAEFCDAFIENSVFTLTQGERIFEAARKMGFKIKVHADEIMPLGGAGLAVREEAVSADHLLQISDKDIAAMAKSDTIAALLPSTAFCLNKDYAPARKMIDQGCAVALASDFNPGSCFSHSIPLMIALAVIRMGMTLEETITALTLNGAAAVDRAASIGSIEPGKQADLVLLGCPDYKYLVYYTGENLVDTVIKNGKVVQENHYEI